MKAVQNPKVTQFMCLTKAFDHAVSRTHSEYAPIVDFTLFKGEISLMIAKTDGKNARIVQVIVGKETDELQVHFFGSLNIMISGLQRHLANNGEDENLVAEYHLQGFIESAGINAFNKRHSELAFMIWAFLQKGACPTQTAEIEEFWPELANCTQKITFLNKN